MSALLFYVFSITALCLSIAEFAIIVVELQNELVDPRSQLQLQFNPALSAMLIILVSLLLHYGGNEAAVLILPVSLCSVGSIIQV